MTRKALGRTLKKFGADVGEAIAYIWNNPGWKEFSTQIGNYRTSLGELVRLIGTDLVAALHAMGTAFDPDKFVSMGQFKKDIDMLIKSLGDFYRMLNDAVKISMLLSKGDFAGAAAAAGDLGTTAMQGTTLVPRDSQGRASGALGFVERLVPDLHPDAAHPADSRTLWQRVMPGWLSRDSWLGQRGGAAFTVEGLDAFVDGLVERCDVGERLMREVIRLEVVPHHFDVVEFRCVFWQPLDGEPVRASGDGGARKFADVDRPIVLDQHDRFGRPAGHGAVELVELLEMGDEVAAALGRAGMDDELAGEVIERAKHCHLLGLSRRRHAQVGAGLRPRSGKIGMRQRLALVAVEQHDVAGCGLLLAQVQAQADAIHLAGDLAPLQRVTGPPPAELFFRNALDNCDRLIRTPALASISARRRAIVQFGRSATGSSSSGVTTRNAASLFTGGGPGAMLACNAATPPLPKSLRHSRTVSSRTPNASAIRALVQPESVSSTARARSASPRSRDPASAPKPTRCSELASTGDLLPMPRTPKPLRTKNRNSPALVKPPESA